MLLAVDAAVRAVAVAAKVGDAVARAADAAPARVGAALVKANGVKADGVKVDGDPAKVGAVRARAEEAHGRADAVPVREASRHVIRRSRVPEVPGVPKVPGVRLSHIQASQAHFRHIRLARQPFPTV